LRFESNILLIKDDIRDVVTALDLERKTVAKIKQNLFWAFEYNTGLIPVATRVLVFIFGIGIFGCTDASILSMDWLSQLLNHNE
jgi:cation transport ATPase